MPITTHQRTLRRRHLGSSDAPAILGVSPWSTPSKVYWSKVLDSTDSEPTAAMQTGNRLESPLLDYAAAELGVGLLRNQFRVSQSGVDNGILAANFDALIPSRPTEAVECKYVGPQGADQWGEQGTAEVPDHVAVQVQHQIHVGNLDRVWVAAAVATRWSLDWRLYCVPRHEQLVRILVDREVEFWRSHVLPQVPPDDAPPPAELLKLVRRPPGKEVWLDDQAAALAAQWNAAKAAANAGEKEAERLRAALLAMLGDGEIGHLPDGRLLTFLSQRGAPALDTKRLRAEWPEVYEAVASERSHRVLREKAAPKGTV